MSTAAQTQILGFPQALRVVLDHAAAVHVPGAEEVALLDSAGRVLAESLIADRDQPPFDRATRDGFAVRAKEWAGGRKLRVAGQIRAGEAWSGGKMRSGTAIEIMTGAPVPRGADAVVMVEHVDRARHRSGKERILAAAARTIKAGDNIVGRASQARGGELLLPAGTAMAAAEIALAASCGRARLAVRERPNIAIVATGDELVELKGRPSPDQIYNSNSYALAAMVAAAGGQPLRLKIARDTRKDLRKRIAKGRVSDLLLLSGGVSAGRYDLVEDVLAEFGAEFLFTGVLMQPGKPLVFGRLPRLPLTKSETVPDSAGTLSGAGGGQAWTYFFGLPGNPVSTQVTFHCFVEPMLRALCGAGVAGPKFVQATLAGDIPGKPGLTRLLPARLTADLERPLVRLVDWQGSGDLSANARANCYAVLPDGRDLKSGDAIAVLLR